MMRRVWHVLGLTLALALVLAAGASAAVQDGGGTELWKDPGSVRFKFSFDGDADPWQYHQGLYVNDPGDDITLRVYGRCTKNAAFPYENFDGPFNLKSPEAPEKDFVVFNPIFLDHWDNDLYKHIKADGDANEKVHLRMWYVPKLEEPVGMTWPVVDDPVSSADVVFEYTYIMLDDFGNDPTHGQATKTQLVFPMAGQDADPGDECNVPTVVGLDNYDINCDGNDEIMSVDAIVPVMEDTTDGEIWVSPEPIVADGMKLFVGDPHSPGMEAQSYMDFLDYRIELLDVSTDERKAQIGIWYIGRGFNQKYFIGAATLTQEGYGSEKDAALVQARFGPIMVDKRENLTPQAVRYPFWVTLEYLGVDSPNGNDYATLTPHRVLKAGETFFVDGAEYDVAAIFVLANPDGTGPEVKYITIRNPIPKGENITINTISVEKQGWKKKEDDGGYAWLLPPFNHTGMHQYVDDINIPDCLQGDANEGTYPDVQDHDNCGDPDVCTGDGTCSCGNLDDCYDTIWERLVWDEKLRIYWKKELKEPRFDTNLMEEKFTEPEEEWQWINIESLPWNFTEFELPARADIVDMGDYLLVSSLVTEDSTEFWPGEGSVRMKFWHDVEYKTKWDAPPDIYVNDGGPGLRLRVYGRCVENAAFPYLTFDGPFNLDSIEAHAKDFVVHNPALFNHFRADKIAGPEGEDLRPLLNKIKADGDAHQKVHLRTWYVPKYYEPAGETYPVVDPLVSTADIVNEYTYLMLDDSSLDPTHGTPGVTQVAFPLAGAGYNNDWGGTDNQVGLDRYDIDDSATHEADELMLVENIVPVAQDTTLGEIWVSADSTESYGMQLGLDDSFDFLDYRVELLDVSTDERKAEIAIYYIGNRDPYLIGQATLQQEGWGSGKDAAITQALFGDIYVNTRDYVEQNWVKAVEYPFWVTLEYLGSGSQWHGNHYALLKPHRVLKAGETFFVDGAEYDVAAIYILANPDGQGPEFKYITIRNPIPKCLCEENDCATEVSAATKPCCDCDVRINDISVIKKAVRPWDYHKIWVLPPFNHPHDRVDDVDIPDDVQGDPNGDVYPDWQYPDNPADEVCSDCDTIFDRLIPDQDPLVMYWTVEEKEPRFDTNLLEEKFTELEEPMPGGEDGELWQWINIETLPWHFTEFLLPDVDDKMCGDPLNSCAAVESQGDYILVSSFMTEDSFVACKPAAIETLTASKLVAQENEPIDFAATVSGDEPIKVVWDFGGLVTVPDVLEGTFAFDEPGQYNVVFQARNECGQDVDRLRILVEPCFGDFDDDDDRDTIDIGMMVPKWNSQRGDGVYDPIYDADKDGDVDLADIMQVVAVWNTDCPFTAD
jgi:hypothetical protein